MLSKNITHLFPALQNSILIFKGAVCKIVAKTGTAITFQFRVYFESDSFPLVSRLPDMLQNPAGT